MTEFNTTYEITKQDYVDGKQLLYSSMKKIPLVMWGMPAVAIMVLLLPFVSRKPDGSIDGFLLGLMPLGAFLLWWSLPYHLPRLNAMVRYGQTGFLGRRFNAHFSDSGVAFRSDGGENKIYWETFNAIAESGRVFAFNAGRLLFIVPKRYLTEEQIACVQQMATYYCHQK